MPEEDPIFVIPTNRLRDVRETVEVYDEHFRRNGHAASIFVFDDSRVVNQQKYYSALEKTCTHNPLYYVGPHEKEQFLAYLFARLNDRKLDLLVRNLFRPSYGGNRNYTLMYTLGHIMVSSDDDMRPYAYVEDSPESLGQDEVSRGKLHRASTKGYTRKSFDILAAFMDVLCKPVREAPANYERGELILDSSMELETNASRGLSRENVLLLQHGPVADYALIKMAQTFRSGTNDIDALDFVEMFLDDESNIHLDDLNMRNPLPSEVFNEEVANLLKRKIKSSVTSLDDLTIKFDYEGEVTLEDSEEILSRITTLHRHVMEAQAAANSPERRDVLRDFGANLERVFYGFEPDFFQQNLIRIVDDVISQFKGSLEIWPTLVEICYLQKNRAGLPKRTVENQRRVPPQ